MKPEQRTSPKAMYYKLEPEVAGHLGDDTVMDSSAHPPIVDALHYEFDGWLGDDLIESFPCYIVTDRMRTMIEAAQATGCRFGQVKISTSEQFEEFRELHSQESLPQFWWLIVEGVPKRDDFGTSESARLVVSERMLHVLKQGRLDHCEISIA